MRDAGMIVVPLSAPSTTPLAGWEVMTEDNVKEFAKKLPRVTSGNGFSISLIVYMLTFSFF